MLTRLFVIIGGLIVLALITALVAPYFINWSDYRDQFEREASRILGQPVTVAGAATARLLPFPSVTFENVTVGDSANPFVAADRFSLDAELTPFLSGEILIFDMRVENPRIKLRLGTDGLPDWTITNESRVDPRRVTLEEARIVNGSIEVIDEVAQRTWALTSFDATVRAQSLHGPFHLDGDTRVNNAPLGFRISTGGLSTEGFALKTTLDLQRAGIEVTLDGRIARPNDASPDPYRGTFTARPRKQTPDLRYLVEGVFSASPRGVDVAEYRAEFGSPEDPYVVSGAAEVAGGADPRYRVEVRGTQFALPEETSGPQNGVAGTGPAAPVADRLKSVQSMLAALPFPPIPGIIDVDLPAIVAGDTTIRDIRLLAAPADDGGGDARRWRVSRFKAQLPGRTEVEADGLLQLPAADGARISNGSGFTGNIVVASRQPSGLAAWLTGSADEAVRRLQTAGLAARVNLSATRQSFDELEIILGPARMHGAVTRISDPARRNALNVVLGGEGIEFDTLEALATVFVGEGGTRRFADHDLDIELVLSTPNIRGVPIEALEASIRSRGMKTEIDRLSLTGVYGASVSATASLDNSDDEFRVAVDATLVSVEGSQTIIGLAERFPGFEPLATLGAIASADEPAFTDTRLDIIGTVALMPELSGEASLSVSGETDGTAISLTTTAIGSVFETEKARVLINGTLENPVAGKLFGQMGLQTYVVDSPGPISMQVAANGSLYDGMKTLVTISAEDLFSVIDGVLTADILSTGFTGTATVAAEDIEPWIVALGYSLPGMGLGTTADIAAAISHRRGKTVLRQINALLNGNRIDGDLTVNTTGDAVKIRGDITAEYIDSGPLLAIAGGDSGAVEPATGSGVDAGYRFGKPLLERHDIELSLKAGEVTFPGSDHVLGDLDTKLAYRDGELTLRDFTAAYSGGTASGLLNVQNNDGDVLVTGQLSARNVVAGTVLPKIAPFVEGRTDLSVQFTGSGRSTTSLIESLSGSGVISTGDISVTGIRADGFAAMIEAADVIGYEIKPADVERLATRAFFGGRAILPAGEYPVTVSGGTARIANAGVVSGALTVTADAALELLTGTVFGNARFGYATGDDSVAGSVPEVILAFRSAGAGTFKTGFDFDPVTGYLTQRALEKEQARVEALQSRLLEKQRLRREVIHFAYLDRTRIRALEEGRLRAFAKKRAEKRADDSRRRALAAEEAARRLSREDRAKPEDTSAENDTPVVTRPIQRPRIEIDKLQDVLPQPVIRKRLDPVNESLLNNPFAPLPESGGFQFSQ